MRWFLPCLLVLAACSGPPPQGPSGPRRTMQLPDGTTLDVPERATRVLPANAAAVDLVIALCEPERLCAIPTAALSWSLIAEDPEPWADHRRMDRFTAEAVLAIEPDLIIASTWSGDVAVQTARDYGIAVLRVPDSHSWENLIEGVELVGEALGETERTRGFVADLEARRAKLAEVDRSGVRVLPYGNFGQGGTTSGSGTTLDLAIELAGMVNVAAESGLQEHPQISLEEVLLFDPDLFLTASGRDGVEAGASFLRGERALEELSAIRDDHIAVIAPELFSSSSHRVLDTAEELARVADEMLGK